MRTSGSLGLFLAICAFMIACKSSKQTISFKENSLSKEWDDIDLFSKIHTGLSVYELDKGQWLFNYRDDNFFVPASCTKILTMYASLKYLDELIPAATYKLKGDTIIVWGGGDPGTLYPDIHATSPLIEFLKTSDKKIIFSDAAFNTTRYGAGWSWDDFPYRFQYERTSLPVYGNRIWIERKKDSISVTPSYFQQILSVKRDTQEVAGRNEWGNIYSYQYDSRIKEANATIPITFFENDQKLIWTELLGKDILWRDIVRSGNYLTIKGSNRDSLIRIMMQESDNFIAEQLLLACSMDQLGRMKESDIIQQLLKGPMHDIPDSIQWVDGSGLSRYNLLTPRSLVWLMRQIIKEKGLEYIINIFPAGGKSGTIREDYKSENGKPYIFAKSGSLRHVYCLTGILMTKSGHALLFSWMNNNYSGDKAKLKLSMDQFFNYLWEHY